MNLKTRQNRVRPLKNAIWMAGRFLAKVFPSRRKGRILICRLDAIGDFVLFAPSLRLLREEYRDAQITLLIEASVRPLAETSPYVDRVRSVNVHRFKESAVYRLLILIRTAVHGGKLFLNPVYSREQISDEIALWSRAPERIAWDSDRSNLTADEKARGDAIYMGLVREDEGKAIHEADRSARFLGYLGIAVPAYRLELWNSRVALESVESIWAAHGLADRTVVAIVPGAMHRFKSWTAASYMDLATRLAMLREDLTFVVIGSEQDRGRLESARHGGLGERLIDLCGATRLQELAPLFARCALVVGNDTGPLHVAAAAGAPVIAIVGGGHYGRFFPYPASLLTPGPPPEALIHPMDCFGCNWKCIFQVSDGDPYPCVAGIPVEMVFDRARSVLLRLFEPTQGGVMP